MPLAERPGQVERLWSAVRKRWRENFIPSESLKGSEKFGYVDENGAFSVEKTSPNQRPITKTAWYATSIQRIRDYISSSKVAAERALTDITNLLRNLDADTRDLFERAVWYREFRGRMLRGEAVPDYIKFEDVDRAVKHLDAEVDKFPEVKSALEMHDQLIRAVGEDGAARGIFPKELREWYMHHMVEDMLDYHLANVGPVKSPRMTTKKIAAERTRSNQSIKEIHRDYVTVMSKYLFDYYEKTMRQDLLMDVLKTNHIHFRPKPDVDLSSLERGEIPRGYTPVNARNGSIYMRGETISERLFAKTLDESVPELAKTIGVSEQELRNAMINVRSPEGKIVTRAVLEAYEARRLSVDADENMWFVVPDEVVEAITMADDVVQKTNPSGAFGMAARKLNAAWKGFKIHQLPIQYNLRNQMGNTFLGTTQFGEKFLDPTLWKEAIQDVANGRMNRTDLIIDFQDMQKGSVLNSGPTAFEVTRMWDAPELAHLQRFEWTGPNTVTSLSRNIRRLLRVLPNAASFIEDVNRAVVYKMNKRRYAELLRSGLKPEQIKATDLYTGAADVNMVEGLMRSNDPNSAFAFIARKSMIDYGDFTGFENQLRYMLVPFYSWSKGSANILLYNLPKAMVQNGISTAAGKQTWKGVAIAATGLGLVRAWNSLVMGDAEDQLPSAKQGPLKLILPDPASVKEFTKMLDAGRPLDEAVTALRPMWFTDKDGRRRLGMIDARDPLDDIFEMVGISGLPAEIGAAYRGTMSWDEVWERQRNRSAISRENATVNWAMRQFGPWAGSLLAVGGVRGYPYPLKLEKVPGEEYASNIASTLLAPGVGADYVASKIQRGGVSQGTYKTITDVPGQLGWNPPALEIPRDRISELQRQLLTKENELRDMSFRYATLLAGLRRPDLYSEARKKQADALFRSIQLKQKEMQRLAERMRGYATLRDSVTQ